MNARLFNVCFPKLPNRLVNQTAETEKGNRCSS